MDNIDNIDDIIEVLRKRMIDKAKMRGSLTHPDVVAISQRLDRFLVLAQRANMANTERYIPTVQQSSEAGNKYLVLFRTIGNLVVAKYTKKHKASPQ